MQDICVLWLNTRKYCWQEDLIKKKNMKWEYYKAEYKQLYQNDNFGVEIILMSTKKQTKTTTWPILTAQHRLVASINSALLHRG